VTSRRRPQTHPPRRSGCVHRGTVERVSRRSSRRIRAPSAPPKRRVEAVLSEQVLSSGSRSRRRRSLPTRRRWSVPPKRPVPNPSTSAVAQSGLQGIEQDTESVSNARRVTSARRPSLSWPCAPPGCALHRLDGGLRPPGLSLPLSGSLQAGLGAPRSPRLPKAPAVSRLAPHTINSRGLSHTAARGHPCTGSPECKRTVKWGPLFRDRPTLVGFVPSHSPPSPKLGE
jgi:hypothetical protein